MITLNELIKGKAINSIEDIKVLDIEIIVKHKDMGHMCTCPNCFFITQGVKMINIK